MPGDIFTGYFTPERRGRFEELRERYPHWCLDWPKVAGLRAPVTPVRRLASAIQEMREDLRSWEVSPNLPDDEELVAWADEVTGRAFRIASSDEGTHDQAEIDIPAIHLALFESIALTLNTRLERGLLLGDWFNRLQLILSSDDRDSSETRAKLARLAAYAWVAGAEAAWSGNQMQQTKADEARERLSQYWRLTGERIGLIPTRKGGKADLIPKKWLSELAKQANELLAAVRAYPLDTAERDAVRALLLAKPYPAGSGHKLVIAQEKCSPRESLPRLGQASQARRLVPAPGLPDADTQGTRRRTKQTWVAVVACQTPEYGRRHSIETKDPLTQDPPNLSDFDR